MNFVRAKGKGQRAKVMNALTMANYFSINKRDDERQLVPHLCLLPFALCPEKARAQVSEGSL
jgi:hypothetical protein